LPMFDKITGRRLNHFQLIHLHIQLQLTGNKIFDYWLWPTLCSFNSSILLSLSFRMPPSCAIGGCKCVRSNRGDDGDGVRCRAIFPGDSSVVLKSVCDDIAKWTGSLIRVESKHCSSVILRNAGACTTGALRRRDDNRLLRRPVFN
jgi:hypothetical protein